MKISELWLREWVSPKVNTQSLCDQLTMAGLEVDAQESWAMAATGVIVVQIESKEPIDDQHVKYQVTDGQKRYCCVSLSSYPLETGQFVPFAPNGATVNSGVVEAKTIKGIQGDGMLCAKETLGLEERSLTHWILPSHLPLGSLLSEQLSAIDQIIDIDLTPNRGDCLSVCGIAREIGAINHFPLTLPDIKDAKPEIDDVLAVDIQAPKACTRYVGRVIKGINAKAITPLWMQEKLTKSGVRVINPVVDVGNYVMLELGQPMHAFDYDTLEEKIIVRFAKQDESITLLDDSTVKCDENTLLIADAKKPLAIAGIMGGVGSGTSDNTTNIFLESALFDAALIGAKARSLGVSSDSSYRFERGVDFTLQKTAIERATQLIIMICGGQAGPIIEQSSQYHPTKLKTLTVNIERVNAFNGVSVPEDTMKTTLTALGFKIEPQQEHEWKVTVPSHRYDVSIEADIAEEIARMYGYHHIPEAVLPASSKRVAPQIASLSLSRIKSFMVDAGFNEAITYSFIDPKLHQLMGYKEALALKNPISSDMSVMRTSLWPGLIQALAHNLRRQQQDVKMFEQGMLFIPGEQLQQKQYVAGLITGKNAVHWDASRIVDFYDLKGVVESLWALNHQPCLEFKSKNHSACHPNQCADIVFGETSIGTIARLHPQIEKQLDFSNPVYLFEIQCAPLQQMNKLSTSEMPSKFPMIKRDLALLVDEAVACGELLVAINQIPESVIQKVELFDLYQGKGIASGKKSIALSIVLQHPSRTLVDDEVEAIMDKVVKNLNQQFGTQLRD